MDSRSRSRNVSSASLASTRRAASPAALSAEEQHKVMQITAACDAGDLSALIRLATTEHGLIQDSLRRTAWPLLLGCSDKTHPGTPWSALAPHRDEGQVALDVNRAFVYYPTGESDKQLDQRKKDLSDLIVEVLRTYPFLCYFQGYHDIVQVFLLVLGASSAAPAVARLSLLRIRDFMLSSLDPAIAHLELLPPIISAMDPVLYNHLPKMQPFFALGATITLFAHVIQGYGDIARLFDFFLARETVIPVYFFAAVLLSRRDELLEIDKEETDILHATLGKLPQPLDLELLIAQTVELHSRLPPDALRGWAWWKVSSYSVLKASSDAHNVAQQSTEDGRYFFQKQDAELRRKRAFHQAMKNVQSVRRQAWAYRRPGAYGLAIAVGVYALWLGRSDGLNVRLGSAAPLGHFIKRVFGIFV